MSPWLKMETLNLYTSSSQSKDSIPVKIKYCDFIWHTVRQRAEKNKIASAYDSRLNLSKCTFLRCNDQCIDKCPMRIDLLVINWSLPFSFIYHSSLSSKISIYFTSFKVRNKKFKWVLHTVVFYSNAHEILKTCFSNQDSHK